MLGPPTPRRPPPRALTAEERTRALEVLHEPRFVDLAPAQVYAILLDEGVYLASESTFYRLLRAAGETRPRRAQARHPAHVKPELVADAPNRCWSWDITKLAGPAKWTAYHLYVVIDIYSRYVVGWTVAERKTSELAKTLLDQAIATQHVDRGQLPSTPTADRRWAPNRSRTSSPTSASPSPTAAPTPPTTTRSPKRSSRPSSTSRRSPARSGPSRTPGRSAARSSPTTTSSTVHSGLGLHTPADVHHGRAADVRRARAAVLDTAYRAHPDRFVRKRPHPPALPGPAWINRPDTTDNNAH